ncbi:uncharacterized protein LOC143912560 [Arctopsyche grandis]|uniref:uncharacterized protein LOC143912560 n=1 Tax=Arctopsyche grandis TaxID=121162 RepID=UPI00406D9995
MASARIAWNISILVLTLTCAISAEENAENQTLATRERSDAPDLMSVLKCSFEPQPAHCARQYAGKMLDSWEDTLEDEMKSWGEAADTEVLATGRQLSTNTEMPSEAAQKLQLALNELASILQRSVSKSMARKKEGGGGGGGVSSITITAGGDEDKKKKKKEKKKKKPANIHIHQDMVQEETMEMDKGVLAEYPPAKTEGTMIQGLWVDKELAGPAKTRIKREQDEDEDEEVRDVEGKGLYNAHTTATSILTKPPRRLTSIKLCMKKKWSSGC